MLPGSRRINDCWYTPVLPYRSGDTAVDGQVLCKCHAYEEDSKHPIESRDLIPADLLYDVALGHTPEFFRSVAVSTGVVG